MKKQVQVHACIIYMPCPTCPSTFTCSTCLTCWLCSFTCITCYFACFTCLFTCFACSFTCSTCSFAWSNMFDMVFYMFIHGWHVLWHVPACTWYSMDTILLISTQRILKIGSSRLKHANITSTWTWTWTWQDICMLHILWLTMDIMLPVQLLVEMRAQGWSMATRDCSKICSQPVRLKSWCNMSKQTFSAILLELQWAITCPILHRFSWY